MEEQSAGRAPHGRRGRDAKGERQNSNGGPPSLAAEGAEGVADILLEVIEVLHAHQVFLTVSRRLQQISAGFVHRTESTDRLVAGGVGGHSLTRELFSPQREVQQDLVLDVALPGGASPNWQGEEPLGGARHVRPCPKRSMAQHSGSPPRSWRRHSTALSPP